MMWIRTDITANECPTPPPKKIENVTILVQYIHCKYCECLIAIQTSHKCFLLLFAVAALHDKLYWRQYPRQFNKLF